MAVCRPTLTRTLSAFCAAVLILYPASLLAVAAEGQATTSVDGGTFDLNAFLGADRYYTNATPITGQNTVSVNLEAGHIWNGHETLQHVSTFYNTASAFGGGAVAPLYDRHATWAAMFIGGRETTNSPSIKQEGIAPGTDLRSAAIATNWSGPAYALSFGVDLLTTLIPVYDATFGTVDVINSSFGGGDPDGTGALAWLADAYSFANPGTLYVVSAGNDGPAANTVGAPGSGYNVLTVGALGSANTFNTVASFSSRGPQDFGYFVSGTNYVTVSNVRAAVDLAAPGESLTSAFYGGQTGGNNTNLAGSSNLGTNPSAYSASIAGTSFAAPIVAGGAALVYSAAETLPQLSTNAEAGESMVVKSLLLTGADKTSGWSNGQAVTNGVITTTQSLDWAVGAGRMNLDRTFDLQVNGQTGVSGQSSGAQGSVLGSGWDFSASLIGINNDYTIGDVLLGGSAFTTSLSWMRAREYDPGEISLFENAQADLNVSLWSLGSDFSFESKVAESVSLYNTVEHLSFALPSTGTYGLRVSYAGNTFDNTGTWGTGTNVQTYGLAWAGSAVDTLYWNPAGTNDAWNGATAVFNTAAGGEGSTTAATTTNTQVVFGAGTNLSGPVVVDGARAAAGLVVQGGAFTFDGTNAASLTLGRDGISIHAAASTNTTFGSAVDLLLADAQSWINAAVPALTLQGEVGGTGDLELRADESGDLTLSGTVDPAGALANSGLGTGTTTITGAIGPSVTGVTQDSATSQLVLSASNSYIGPTTVNAGELVLASSTGGAAAATSAVNVAGGATLLLRQSDQVNDVATITLSGGTIRRDGSASEIFGNLNLTTASFLDYGAAQTTGLLRFGAYTPESLLTVLNFLPGNKLQFGNTLTQEQLDNGGLFAFSNAFASGMEGGVFTITAIPETSTWVAAAGLIALILWPMRRRASKEARPMPGLRAVEL